jgi:hypothetical protein
MSMELTEIRDGGKLLFDPLFLAREKHGSERKSPGDKNSCVATRCRGLTRGSPMTD